MRKLRLMAVTKRAASEKGLDDASLADSVVAKARKVGATDAVALVRRSDSQQVKFANSQVVVVQSWMDTSLDIFAVFGKKVLSSSINDMEGVDEALANLKRKSAGAPVNEDYWGIASGRFKYRKSHVDKRVVDAEEKLVNITWNGIGAALDEGADRCAGVLHRYRHWTTMSSSRGVGFEEEGASLAFSLRAFNRERGSGHAVSCSTTLGGLDPEGAGREAADFCNLAKSPKTGPEGRMNVLFTPMSAADLPLHVAGFASATQADAGMSFLKDKVGKKVGSEAITIIDDGTLPEGMGSQCADEEGVPTRRTEIIREGKFLTYLHNTSTAKKHKAANTANAGLLMPRPWNVVVPSGDMSREELLEEMREGIVVTNVWYSRFQNYLTGDYSTIPRDAILLVKKGEIAGAVKGIRVSDNMERMLKGVKALGKNQTQVQWWETGDSSPTFISDMLVGGVGVTKSTM
jgi:PmbA protein